MIEFISRYWTVIVSLASLVVAVLNCYVQLLRIKQLRQQLRINQAQLDSLCERKTIEIVEPSEEQFRRLRTSSGLFLGITLVFFAVSLYLSTDLRVAQISLEDKSERLLQVQDSLEHSRFLVESLSPEYTDELQVALNVLRISAERGDSLKNDVKVRETELQAVHDAYSALLNVVAGLQVEGLSRELEIATIQMNIDRHQSYTERVKCADSLLSATNDALLIALESIRSRNESLIEVKTRLEHGHEVPVPLFTGFDLDTRDAFTPLEPETYTLLPIDSLLLSAFDRISTEPMARAYGSMSNMTADTAGLSVALTGKDVLSIVRARAELADHFSRRLQRYLASLDSAVVVTSDSVRSIGARCTKAQIAVDRLTQNRDVLLSGEKRAKEILAETENAFEKTNRQHAELSRAYSREHSKQLSLLEDIGVLRVKLELRK